MTAKQKHVQAIHSVIDTLTYLICSCGAKDVDKNSTLLAAREALKSIEALEATLTDQKA
jgi:hypothetical protein